MKTSSVVGAMWPGLSFLRVSVVTGSMVHAFMWRTRACAARLSSQASTNVHTTARSVGYSLERYIAALQAIAPLLLATMQLETDSPERTARRLSAGTFAYVQASSSPSRRNTGLC